MKTPKPSKLESLRGLPNGMQRQFAGRPGTKLVYAGKPGEKVALLDGGSFIVAHPDRVPELHHRDGTVEKIDLSAPAAAVKKSRAKNPEAYRDYQREYMRKRRAADKAPK